MPTDTTITWSLDGPTPQLILDAPADQEVVLHYRVSLGNLRHFWDQEGVRTEDDGRTAIAVVLPEEAWLDDLAEDYVTDLV